MSALRDWGPRYLDMGWSVIPIAEKTKQPPAGFGWKRYQAARPTMGQLAEWDDRFFGAGVAVVTGRTSGLVVLDVDGGKGGWESLKEVETLEKGPVCRTPGGGAHFYFKHPGEYFQCRVGIMPGLDIRGDGGYVAAPASVHPNGAAYQWEIIPPCPLPPLPDFLRQKLNTEKRAKPHFKNTIPKSERNSTVFWLACSFAQDTYTLKHFIKRVSALNQLRCEEPLEDKELKDVITNAWKYKQNKTLRNPWCITYGHTPNIKTKEK